MPISLCQQLDVPSRLKAGKLPRWDDHEIISSGVVRCLVEAVLKNPLMALLGPDARRHMSVSYLYNVQTHS